MGGREAMTPLWKAWLLLMATGKLWRGVRVRAAATPNALVTDRG
jgi:hypothetical protein